MYYIYIVCTCNDRFCVTKKLDVAIACPPLKEILTTSLVIQRNSYYGSLSVLHGP